jgi:valyl-tRNA synthetase
MQARVDATREAMGAIESYDADRVREALLAVARDHPVDDAVREACAAEVLRGMAASEPLDGLEDALACPLLAPGRAPWGLAVYRVAYGGAGADAAWRRMLDLIGAKVREDLEMMDRLDLLPRHRLVVVDDRARFDGASPDRVREHFTEWAEEELRRNWREEPVTDDEIARWYPTGRLDQYAGTRYNFCLLVDDICLESLEKMSGPVVKLVRKDLALDEPELGVGEDGDDGDDPGWEGGVTNGEFEDVGWMYMHLSEYVDVQNNLHEPDNWVDDYVRPPLMHWPDDFETAPGFWRRGGKSDSQ